MRKSIISCLLVILFACTAITVSAKTIYISSSGSDTSNGTSSSPFATLSAAYKALSGDTDIILLDSASFVNPPAHSGKLTLKGNTSSVTLTLPSETILAGQLKFDNLTLNTGTIYANGHTLEISSTVTSTGAIAVFGGKKGASLTGNTDIRLYGGQYSSVFGGCNGGTVNGNTNVIFGGNAKQSGALYIYGGSSNAAVNGTSTVTLEGNAQCTYIFGAGNGANGTTRVTDIYIKGGNVVEAVYGGANSATATNNGAVYNITMTGGKTQAIFGGNIGSSVNGHTFVNLLGGEVTRRVYTGCYNNATNKLFSYSYDTDHHVIGTTVLRIAPGPNLITGSDGNRGIFSGSRTKSQHDEEQNTIIYLDNCYNTYSKKIGEKSGFYTSSFKSHHDYVVNAGSGGDVLGTKTAGKVYIAPDRWKYATIGSNKYYNQEATVSSNTTVSFTKAFNINSVIAVGSEKNAYITADVTIENMSNEPTPTLFVGLYDGTRCIAASFKKTPSSDSALSLVLPFDYKSDKIYTVKVMLTNNKLSPLSSQVQTNLKYST